MTSPENAELALIEELLLDMGHKLDSGVPLGDLTVEKLELDSLSTLELLMMIEDRTGVEVPADPVENNTTLAQLAEFIRQQPAA